MFDNHLGFENNLYKRFKKKTDSHVLPQFKIARSGLPNSLTLPPLRITTILSLSLPSPSFMVLLQTFVFLHSVLLVLHVFELDVKGLMEEEYTAPCSFHSALFRDSTVSCSSTVFHSIV